MNYGDAVTGTQIHHWAVPLGWFEGTGGGTHLQPAMEPDAAGLSSHLALRNWAARSDRLIYGLPPRFKGFLLSADGRVGLAIER